MPPVNLFKGMRVLITQNRDKKNGVVNGQTATVHMVQNVTLFLKLPNGRIVNMYPVTCPSTIGLRTIVYPFPTAYALTICKVQGLYRLWQS